MPKAALVIPCYNEEKRLDDAELGLLAERRGLQLILVNDGSTDRTAERLQAFAAKNAPARALLLERRGGKAEAIRRGFVEAFAAEAEIIGYADADFSTPAEEILRLLDETLCRDVRVVLGSRVQLLGSDIRRRVVRHYLGRVFSTGASLALGLRVYDTQCGAKFFRATDELKAAMAVPFASRWAFDVELIDRLLGKGYGAEDLLEVPLKRWRDVKGSKLTASAAAAAFLDVAQIGLRRLRR
jgi:glycosyltransferase involved in cell wall biosynthesis